LTQCCSRHGTRGLASIPVAIRPEAWGAATFEYEIVNRKPHFHNIEAIGGQVPGEQTVPRAELYVLLYLAERLEPYSIVTFVTDNQKTCETYNKGKQAAMRSTNCDLFKDIFSLIDMHSLSIHVRWMPSHLKPDDIRPEGVSVLDVIGNNFADIQAGEAAKRRAVPVTS
jgi:hypothetical protein